MIYYPVPLHKMKVFDKRCKVNGGLKESEKAVAEVLSLPMEPLMGKEMIMHMVNAIKMFFSN